MENSPTKSDELQGIIDNLLKEQEYVSVAFEDIISSQQPPCSVKENICSTPIDTNKFVLAQSGDLGESDSLNSQKVTSKTDDQVLVTCSDDSLSRLISKSDDSLLKKRSLMPGKQCSSEDGPARLKSKKKKQLSVCVTEKTAVKDLPNYFSDGTWVQCTRASCNKWRHLADVDDPSEISQNWNCSMNPDQQYNDCSKDQLLPDESKLSYIDCQYVEGSLVWAKMDTYPWWPAMVESDPDLDTFYDCKLNLKVMSDYHVVFLDEKATRIWLPASKLKHYRHRDEGKELNGTATKGTLARQYSTALSHAISNAEQAATMSQRDRLRAFSFVRHFRSSAKKRKSAAGHRHRENPQTDSTSQKKRKTLHQDDTTRNDQQKPCKSVFGKQAVGAQKVVKQGYLSGDKVFCHVDDIPDPGIGKSQEVATKKTDKKGSVKKHKTPCELLQSHLENDELQSRLVRNELSTQKKVKIAKDTQILCSDSHQKLKKVEESKKTEKNLNLLEKTKKSHSKNEAATEIKLKVKKAKKHKLEYDGQLSEQDSRTYQNNVYEATVVNMDLLHDPSTEQHVLDQLVKDITLLETVIAEAEIPTSVEVSKMSEVKKHNKNAVNNTKTLGTESTVGLNVKKIKKMKTKEHTEISSDSHNLTSASSGEPQKVKKKLTESVNVSEERGIDAQKCKTKKPKKSKPTESGIEKFIEPSADTNMDVVSGEGTHKDRLKDSSFSRDADGMPRHPQKKPIFNKSADPQIHQDVQLLTEETGCEVRVLKDIADLCPVQHATCNASQESIVQSSKAVVEKRKPVFQVNKKRLGTSAVVRAVDEE